MSWGPGVPRLLAANSLAHIRGLAGLVLAAVSLGWPIAWAAPAPRLLVIAPDRFHPALKEFVGFKQTELPTTLVSLEQVLRAQAGVDDPERLKRFLYHEWKSHHAGYALLVGDADVFPVRYMVLDRVTPAAFDYAFYPSDLYYSDLAKRDGSFDDWNGRKDGFHASYFGEVRGEKNKGDPINFDQIDYRPELAVGRWPVSTVEEVRRVVGKSMRYERQLASGKVPGLRQAAFLAVGGWVDSRPLLEQLAGKMPPTWTIHKRYYQDGLDYHTAPPTESEIENLLNQGVSLMCHTGHGTDDSWEQCFFLRHLDRLKNEDRLPVMLSIGCSTARFATLPPYEPYMDLGGQAHEGSDHKEVFTVPPPPPACYQKGRHNPVGLGEQLLRQGDGGAVAYIGCCTGSQPCALTLMEGFIETLGRSPTPRLGECWAGAISYYYDHEQLGTLKPNADWYPPSIFFQGMKFMLFGDPSLPLPSREKSGADHR